MDYMFYNNPVATATSTGSWDTSSVINMRGMFQLANVANPSTATWNVSAVTDMREMFYRANSANPDVLNWNTANVTTMFRMFRDNPSANPNMTNWNFSNNPDLREIFTGTLSSMTNANYSNFLIAVEATTTHGSNKRIDANNLEYQPAAATARANLLSNGWTVNDNGAE